jgi:uncharacterized cofD-like protein
LYTSIIPNLLVPDITAAMQTSRAIKIYVCNLMTQLGETDGYSAADHVRVVREYLPSIDVCILNSSDIGTGVAERYSKFGSEIVADTPDDEEEIRRSGVVLVGGSLLKEGEIKARHDPAGLARLVVSAACGFIPAAEVTCDQRNGR